MPRDGSGTYTYPPGTPGIPDTTIESAKYNGYIADIQQDLNLPRPIVAGGTGANNVTQARANLKAEVAAAVVTNYDSQVWETGSFVSGTGATAGPVPGANVAGVCIVSGPNDVMLRAYDAGIGNGYLKIKSGGVWGSWISDKAVTDTDYVNVTGDTMTGNLLLPYLVTNSGGQTYQFGGSSPRGFYTDPTNIAIRAAASGAVLIQSENGGVTYGAFNTGGLSTATLTTTGDINAAGSFVASTVNAVLGTTGAGTVFLRPNGVGSTTGQSTLSSTGVLFISSDLLASGTVTSTGTKSRSGISGPHQTNMWNFSWTGGLHGWVDATDLGAITFSSDYRIKKDVADLSSTWDTVKALRPIKYTQAQYTPQIEKERMLKEAAAAREQTAKDGVEPKPAEQIGPMFAADDIERWGFIAHELQATMVPSAASGVKDDPNSVQSPNPWTMLAAVTKALQEAMARIESLEAAQAP